ncbi:MAG TPA: histidine phosphatase family protein [Bryobacteraceae bacterium]|jgi:broad specificity phosphatase PhoE
MSTLTLIRHGQATPFEKITDRLSPLGVQQSKRLGDYWRAQGIVFHQIVCGSLTRHRQTLEASGLRASGGAPLFDPGWNEYRADEILAKLSPALEAKDEHYAKLVAVNRAAMEGPERNRHFQRMLEVLMEAWLGGAIAAGGVETFDEFEARVTKALRAIFEGVSGRDVAVITSGGPIGLCVQRALNAPGKAFLDVNWRMRNTSITEFTFSSSRFTLDTLNGLPHLEDRGLWTWR